jgi:hypothetical protein
MRLVAPDDFPGGKVRCKECGAKFVVAKDGATAELLRVPTAEQPTREPLPRPKLDFPPARVPPPVPAPVPRERPKRSGPPRWVRWAALTAVGCLIGVGVALQQRPSEPPARATKAARATAESLGSLEDCLAWFDEQGVVPRLDFEPDEAKSLPLRGRELYVAPLYLDASQPPAVLLYFDQEREAHGVVFQMAAPWSAPVTGPKLCELLRAFAEEQTGFAVTVDWAGAAVSEKAWASALVEEGFWPVMTDRSWTEERAPGYWRPLGEHVVEMFRLNNGEQMMVLIRDGSWE